MATRGRKPKHPGLELLDGGRAKKAVQPDTESPTDYPVMREEFANAVWKHVVELAGGQLFIRADVLGHTSLPSAGCRLTRNRLVFGAWLNKKHYACRIYLNRRTAEILQSRLDQP